MRRLGYLNEPALAYLKIHMFAALSHVPLSLCIRADHALTFNDLYIFFDWEKSYTTAKWVSALSDDAVENDLKAHS